MHENELSRIILDASFSIHKELGPGVFESVYEAVLEYELVHEHGLALKRQVPIPVIWKEMRLDLGFRADMIVENKVIVEVKSIEMLAPVHAKQSIDLFKNNQFEIRFIDKF